MVLPAAKLGKVEICRGTSLVRVLAAGRSGNVVRGWVTITSGSVLAKEALIPEIVVPEVLVRIRFRALHSFGSMAWLPFPEKIWNPTWATGKSARGWGDSAGAEGFSILAVDVWARNRISPSVNKTIASGCGDR